MKLTVLTENIADNQFLAEHGLSYLIEIDNKKLLFDTGHSDIFIRNAKKLGISIQNEINTIVLSHGHWDHGNGLSYLNDKTLVTHPSSFIQRFRKKDRSSVGLNQSFDKLNSKFTIIQTKYPYQLSSNLIYLGEIPRLNDFEAIKTAFIDANEKDDFIPDDSALVAVLGEKIVIVTGCSHSGIVNICEYAKRVTRKNHIKAVIGGFHLKRNNEQTEKTVAYFKANKVDRLYPSHCTELAALTEFNREFSIGSVKTGMTFIFDKQL